VPPFWNPRNPGRDIVVSSIPSPGDYRAFTEAMAEISAEPVTVSGLWRYTVLEGMEGGKVAVFCQMHHALFDGLGAVQALSSMMDQQPVTPEKPTGRTEPAADEPSPYALLGDAIAESAERLFVKTPNFLRENTLPILGSMAGGIRSLLSEGVESIASPAVDSTSLNIGASSGRRSIAYKTLSLPNIKALARHFECTVNDVALLLFSFALQHYFAEIGEEIDFDLWCGMPISTRTEGSRSGNQVTAGRINLHTTNKNPVKRLRAIHQDTVESKKSVRSEESPIDTGALGEVIPPPLLDGLMYLSNRFKLFDQLGTKLPVFHALLSNIPGPPNKVYIANALLAESIPLIPAVGLIAVSGGITSVGDSITLGFHCDGKAVPKPDLMVEGVELGLRDLRKASRPEQKSRRRKKARPKLASAKGKKKTAKDSAKK
jgi:diacylglycerol O-acyltransferase